MPIPTLNEDGFLPVGIHDCTLAEIRDRFGQFQRTDQRCQLMDRLEAFVQECRATGFVKSLIVDGSFATNRDRPNDIDLIVVVEQHHDFAAELLPFEYNVVSKGAVRQKHQFDIVVEAERSVRFDKAITFFSRIRSSDERKGLLRITL